MEVVAVLVAALVVSVVLGVRLVRPRAGARLRLRPEDVAELDAVGAALAAERHREVAARLTSALDALRNRRVPLARVLGGTGIPGQFVLEFADGTAILARTVGRSDAATVAVAVARERVLLTLWHDTGTHFPLVLSWRGGERVLDAVAVQPAD
nr:hypothetical protein [Propionibacterium sp.]